MQENIYYNSTDGIKLCGILNKETNNNKIIIMCHGIRGNKEEKGAFIELENRLAINGFNSFRFDFRGHGESSGKDLEVTIEKEIEDLEQTINMLQNKGYNEFILLGASFGAGIISLIDKSKYNIKALILWYGAIDYSYTKYGNLFSDSNRIIAEKNGYYPSISGVTGEEFRFSKKLFEEINTYKPYEELIKCEVPKLFIHGKIDRVLPYELSEEICNKCENAEIKLIENGDHSFCNSRDALNEAVLETSNFIINLERWNKNDK